jgi:hypothetical protein
MNKRVVATKEFVKRHRVAIAVIVTSAVWLELMTYQAGELSVILRQNPLPPTK